MSVFISRSQGRVRCGWAIIYWGLGIMRLCLLQFGLRAPVYTTFQVVMLSIGLTVTDHPSCD